MARTTLIIKRTLIAVSVLAVAFTGVVGFAHTQAGRPLLAVIGPALGMGGAHAKPGARCPFGFDVAASPAQKEAARKQFAAAHRGETPAGARPALGFALDQTTRAEVLAWAASHRVTCKKPRSGADLDCQNVPAAYLPAHQAGTAVLQSLWLNFGEGDKLISVVAMRREPKPEPIGAAFDALTAALAKSAGPASTQTGDGAPQALASGLLHQSSAEFRFRDYYALARATNMGDGFLLTEEYRSLPVL